MAILVLLAVFTAEAADGSGRAFATVYATFLTVVVWLFFTVRRQDRRTDRSEFVTDTGRYVTGMSLAVLLILASAFLPAGPRLIVAVVAVAWVVGMFVAGRSSLHRGLPPLGPLSSGSGCSRSSFSAKWCSGWLTVCRQWSTT
jgi:low temperature requirement protein LtrA